MTDTELEKKIADGAPHCADCKHGTLLVSGIYFCKRNKAYAAAERAKVPGRCGPEGVFWDPQEAIMTETHDKCFVIAWRCRASYHVGRWDTKFSKSVAEDACARFNRDYPHFIHWVEQSNTEPCHPVNEKEEAHDKAEQ